MPSMRHTHRYVLKTLGKNYKVYACNKGGCSHYIDAELIEGKVSECWRCGNPFLMGKQVLYGSHGKYMTKPHCPDCTKSKKPSPVSIVDIQDFRTGKEND